MESKRPTGFSLECIKNQLDSLQFICVQGDCNTRNVLYIRIVSLKSTFNTLSNDMVFDSSIVGRF